MIGRTFRMGNELYEIVGVAEAPFTGTMPGTMVDIFVPTMMHPGVTRQRLDLARDSCSRGNRAPRWSRCDRNWRQLHGRLKRNEPKAFWECPKKLSRIF